MKNAKKHFIMMLSLLTGLGGITASAQNKIPKMLEKPRTGGCHRDEGGC